MALPDLPRGQRQRCRAGEQRDEVAPPRLIDWHPLAQPTAGQHIALVKIETAPAAMPRFRAGLRPGILDPDRAIADKVGQQPSVLNQLININAIGT
jgi:hypothetical protein